jgi:hypothetical protein
MKRTGYPLTGVPVHQEGNKMAGPIRALPFLHCAALVFGETRKGFFQAFPGEFKTIIIFRTLKIHTAGGLTAQAKGAYSAEVTVTGKWGSK